MAIIKNEIPILEFDTEQTAVLNPTHENLGLNLPKKCVFAFLGAYIDEYASKSDTKQVSTFESATKHYPFTSPNTRVRTLCFVKHPLVRQQPHRYLIG